MMATRMKTMRRTPMFPQINLLATPIVTLKIKMARSNTEVDVSKSSSRLAKALRMLVLWPPTSLKWPRRARTSSCFLCFGTKISKSTTWKLTCSRIRNTRRISKMRTWLSFENRGAVKSSGPRCFKFCTCGYTSTWSMIDIRSETCSTLTTMLKRLFGSTSSTHLAIILVQQLKLRYSLKTSKQKPAFGLSWRVLKLTCSSLKMSSWQTKKV